MGASAVAGAPMRMLTLRADARGAREFSGHGQEAVVLLARADRDSHAHTEGAHDKADARACLDEAVDVAADQVEVRLAVGDVVAECAQGRDDALALGDDLGDRALHPSASFREARAAARARELTPKGTRRA